MTMLSAPSNTAPALPRALVGPHGTIELNRSEAPLLIRCEAEGCIGGVVSCCDDAGAGIGAALPLGMEK